MRAKPKELLSFTAQKGDQFYYWRWRSRFLAMTPEEFKKVARAAVALNLDNPESVKKQGSRLVAARKKLKEYHAQIVAIEQNKQQPPFTVAELEDDPMLLKRLVAIQQKSGMILDDARWLRLIIESLSVDCNRLIGKAKKYLSPESAPAAKPPKASISSQTRSQPQPEPPAENKLDLWLSQRLAGLFGGRKRWWVKNWRVSAITFFSLTAFGMFLEGTIGGIFGGLLCLGTAAVFAPKVAEWISDKAQGKIGPVLTRTAIAFLCLFLAGTLISGEPSQVATTNSQPVDPWVAAVNIANQANERQQSATGWDSWDSVARQWQEASNKMAAVPSNHKHYATAQEKIAQYSEAATNATAARDEFPQPAPSPGVYMVAGHMKALNAASLMYVKCPEKLGQGYGLYHPEGKLMKFEEESTWESSEIASAFCEGKNRIETKGEFGGKPIKAIELHQVDPNNLPSVDRFVKTSQTPDLTTANQLLDKISQESKYRPQVTTWGGQPTLMIVDTSWSELSATDKQTLINYLKVKGSASNWQVIAGRFKDTTTIYVDEVVCNSSILQRNSC